MWSLAGSQAVDQPICCFGPGLRAAGWSPALGLSHTAGRSSRFGPESHSPGVRCFGPVGGAASLSSQCAPTRGFRCGFPARGFRYGRPAGVSGVGPQSANLGARNQASGESWGCLSCVHNPGAEEGEAPEVAAAVESSLTSR